MESESKKAELSGEVQTLKDEIKKLRKDLAVHEAIQARKMVGQTRLKERKRNEEEGDSTKTADNKDENKDKIKKVI